MQKHPQLLLLAPKDRGDRSIQLRRAKLQKNDEPWAKENFLLPLSSLRFHLSNALPHAQTSDRHELGTAPVHRGRSACFRVSSRGERRVGRRPVPKSAASLLRV